MFKYKYLQANLVDQNQTRILNGQEREILDILKKNVCFFFFLLLFFNPVHTLDESTFLQEAHR